MKKVVSTAAAPQAIGPYSQGIEFTGPGRMLFLSGQIALHPDSGELVGGGVQAEARQALENLARVVEAAGYSLGDVVKTTIYLADMGDFPAVNEIYAGFFAHSPPARATVAVAALPKSALVEIDATCCLSSRAVSF